MDGFIEEMNCCVQHVDFGSLVDVTTFDAPVSRAPRLSTQVKLAIIHSIKHVPIYEVLPFTAKRKLDLHKYIQITKSKLGISKY